MTVPDRGPGSGVGPGRRRSRDPSARRLVTTTASVRRHGGPLWGAAGASASRPVIGTWTVRAASERPQGRTRPRRPADRVIEGAGRPEGGGGSRGPSSFSAGARLEDPATCEEIGRVARTRHGRSRGSRSASWPRTRSDEEDAQPEHGHACPSGRTRPPRGDFARRPGLTVWLELRTGRGGSRPSRPACSHAGESVVADVGYLGAQGGPGGGPVPAGRVGRDATGPLVGGDRFGHALVIDAVDPTFVQAECP